MGYFGNFKTVVEGIHQGVSHKHLGLYLNEFDYKYNTREISDWARTEMGIKMVSGRRPKYHESVKLA